MSNIIRQVESEKDYQDISGQYGSSFTKFQFSIINRAFLTCCIGFFFIMLVGYIVYFGLLSGHISFYNYSLLGSLSSIFGTVMIVSYFVWIFKLRKSFAINTWSIVTMVSFCLSTGFAFSVLFYILQMQELLLIFATAFFIFFCSWLISKILSAKAVFTITKFLSILIGLWFIFFLVIMIINLTTPFFVYSGSVFGYNPFLDYLNIIITLVSGIIFIADLVLTFWLMRQSENFSLVQDSKEANGLAFFYGFKLLVDLIGLIWMIVRLFLRFR